MANEILRKLYEHNNWANITVIETCSQLSDEQLDAEPGSATKGSIRMTLWHLMASQQRYLSLLTGAEPRFNWQSPPAFDELLEAGRVTGDGLAALAEGEPTGDLKTQFQGKDYLVGGWVVMLQAVNHATEHREQIKSMLSDLGITPPEIDGWTYGDSTGSLSEVT